MELNHKSLQEITDYIAANEPHVKDWIPAKFEKWVHWHYSEGLIQCAIDFDGSIAGIVMVRPCMIGDAADPYVYDQEGNCLFISEVVCTGRKALQALGLATLKRFGMRDYVAWKRPPYYVMQIHKAKDLRRNLFREMETSHGPRINA